MRLLHANEIEVRVATIKQNGCSLLLYKDARVDMKILDEVYGPNNWQRTHEVINGNLFCNIDLWDDEKKTWVRKQDVGVESYTEKEKGQASDSFKRAGFNIGIGRELYTAPFIWVMLGNDETYESGKDNRGKPKFALNPKVKFTVKEIDYNDQREISHLVIADSKGNIRFELGKVITNKAEAKATEKQIIEYSKLTKELAKHNKFDYQKFMTSIKENDNVNNVAELTSNRLEYYLDLFRKQLDKFKKNK